MAINPYLKIAGLPGASTSKQDAIDVISWNLSATQDVGQVGGKVEVHDFSFVKGIDKISPKLFEACVRRDHISEVVLVCDKPMGDQQEEFLRLTFSDCLISSYNSSGAESGGPMMEQVAINFAKVSYEYREERGGRLEGTIKTEFDLKALKVGE